MASGTERHDEIFSFHLAKLSLAKLPRFLMSSVHKQNVPGLKHSESLMTMNLGEPIMSGHRYGFETIAFFAWWTDETSLEEFMKRPTAFESTWHVRMKLYRRWGEVTELKDAFVDPSLASPDEPVVAVTLARSKILETRRFIKWGRPVEAQVRDHQGKRLALAAIRPLNTFSTFSIWKSEQEMLGMVSGKDGSRDGESHRSAMQERVRKDFHHEFTTMRFVPLGESGIWQWRSDYTSP